MNLGGAVHLNKRRCLLAIPLLVLLYYVIWGNSHVYREIVGSQINLKKLLELAVKASVNGGLQVTKHSDHYVLENKGKTKEGADMRVTTADYKSHCVMLETIKSMFPALDIISEESRTKCDKMHELAINEIVDDTISALPDHWVIADDITVWIDPLDATQEYTEKLFKYVTTMVCISVKGKPIVGVIHFPFSNTTHWAWVGNGNSYNAHFKKHIEAEDRLKIIVSRSHKGEVDREIRKRFRGKQVDIEVAGGAGYKVHEVAMGNVDVYFHVTQISKWDICAGNAILDALGGRMVTLDNQKITYGNTKTAVNDNGLIGARSHKVLDGVFNLS